MTPPLVVPDASVLLKWALRSPDEAERDAAIALRAAWLEGRCRLMLPSLWAYEVANVLGLKQPRLAADLVRLLLAYVFDEIPVAALFDTALKLMTRTKVTFYDAAYHAVALDHDGVLVTADAAYVRRAANVGHVTLLRHWTPPA